MASPTRSWAGEGRTTTSTTECTMLVSELQGWRRMGSTRWPNMLTRSKILRWKDFCKLADEGSAHIMSHKFALFWQCIYGGSSATNGFLTDQMNYQEDKCRIRIDYFVCLCLVLLLNVSCEKSHHPQIYLSPKTNFNFISTQWYPGPVRQNKQNLSVRVPLERRPLRVVVRKNIARIANAVQVTIWL